MFAKTVINQGRITREWECCGRKWELMMSKLYPKRYDFKPICPKCGSIGKSFSEATADTKSSHVRVE